MATKAQEKAWIGEFGKQYTDRNIKSPEDEDKLYFDDFRITRTALYKEFFENEINKNSKILEVGCNIGQQLLLLQKMNYTDLWAIDLQDYAVEIAKRRTRSINIIKASASDIPFKDNYFDLVFTAGVLIHISPKDIEKVLDENYRCSNSYIMGLEYYVPQGYQMVNYQGKNDLMWKTDFLGLYLNRFSNLKLIRKKILKYRYNDNSDIFFLLKKI